MGAEGLCGAGIALGVGPARVGKEDVWGDSGGVGDDNWGACLVFNRVKVVLTLNPYSFAVSFAVVVFFFAFLFLGTVFVLVTSPIVM